MAKHTIRIGARHLAIDVEQLSERRWWASTSYRGERIEAHADTEQGAVSELLAELKSEIAGAGK